MNYLIVGLGRRGALHLECIEESRKSQTVFTFDTRESIMEVGADYRMALSKQIDSILKWKRPLRLAVIATPPVSHMSILSLLLGLNCRVIVEKPIVSCAAEVSALERLSRSERERVFVGYSERFNPVVAAARARICATVRAGGVQRLKFDRGRPESRLGYPAEPCLELMVHDLDFVLNRVFPKSPTDGLVSCHSERLCTVSGLIDGIHVVLKSRWTEGGSISTAVVDDMKGRIEVDLSSGGDIGRMLALKNQLDIVESTSASADVAGEIRVLRVLLDGR
ncbi:Gfo/Idh/MocA family oxidoreductase [Nocardia sp. SYP-A9097]|uniref:Gfo/Idh/MocA family protein n=1 Tax=Nocardia sp. SYP-A9097 TaxID=2663237 RepID=UPI00129A692B|nr:Gfo/Idh/MocA family oxidoreductase [Nocardia sp. SYP-A9097]